MAEEQDTPFLGEIPIDPAIRKGGDSGKPAARVEGSPVRAAFLTLAGKVAELAVEV